VPFALATSSHYENFVLKTNHLRDGFDLFGKHVVVGDDARIPKGRGKPHPDIWQVALASLNEDRAENDKIQPEECLVFEDGMPGVVAGKAAGCRVVWVPDEKALKVLGHEKVAELIGDHEILGSLEDFDRAKYGLP
jgi:pseudouridine-5'-monophosphatase